MSTSAPAAGGSSTDNVALPGYYDLALNGLDTLTFTNVSGLAHAVQISGQAVSGVNGGSADARTVAPPTALNLSMDHVVITSDSVWSWLTDTITSRGGPTSAKEGTLSLNSLGGTSTTPLQSWRLSSVYLTGVSLGSMGVNGSTYLAASITMLVGECIPSTSGSGSSAS